VLPSGGRSSRRYFVIRTVLGGIFKAVAITEEETPHSVAPYILFRSAHDNSLLGNLLPEI
jgi:hypothetical protein